MYINETKKTSLKGLALALAVLMFSLPASVSAFAQEESPEAVVVPRTMDGLGVWVGNGMSRTSAEVCVLHWACDFEETVSLRENEDLASSDGVTTTGACIGDEFRSCGACSAPAPIEVCSWQIVPIPGE